jgi:hypothetical protein
VAVGEARQDIMAKEDIIPMTDLEEGGGEEVDFQIFALFIRLFETPKVGRLVYASAFFMYPQKRKRSRSK